ncbi:MAG: 30S ribosomal protein S16 [Spirochaetaceae bacterium]|nr:MAG: 30S ribosomal protein S16 [Spirochaetaceae bacterium]
MSVKIRLKRLGTKKRPCYRVVAIDSRSARDSRPIEELGYYQPVCPDEEGQVRLKEDRIREWLKNGAIPSPTVKRLLNRNDITVK